MNCAWASTTAARGTSTLEPVLQGELDGPLQAPEVFVQVDVDPEGRALVWPNGADFDPAILHDWPQHRQAIQDHARRWALASV